MIITKSRVMNITKTTRWQSRKLREDFKNRLHSSESESSRKRNSIRDLSKLNIITSLYKRTLKESTTWSITYSFRCRLRTRSRWKTSREIMSEPSTSHTLVQRRTRSLLRQSSWRSSTSNRLLRISWSIRLYRTTMREWPRSKKRLWVISLIWRLWPRFTGERTILRRREILSKSK